MKVHERFVWACDVMSIRPNDKILEIGCGPGILVQQIAGRLTGGVITAIDRSAAMLKAANGRNREFIENGIAQFLPGEFLASELQRNAFDKIVAFNVNFFWKRSEEELKHIKKYLKPDGRLYIFYQLPHEITIEAAKPMHENLQANGFDIIDAMLKKLKPTSAFCIISKPKSAR